jgi:hypothetical protein
MKMNARQSIVQVAALALTLIGASVAHAQGSTDIYTTNFQQAYAAGHAVQGTGAAGSTDIYATNFQRAFATADSLQVAKAPDANAGSTDIYGTNFQSRYM